MRASGRGGSSAYFSIFETRRFRADLAGLGSVAQKRIESKLLDHVYPILQKNPYFGPNIKRLKNWEPPTWRYRVGQWRFFYEVDDQRRIVSLIAADHRRQAYR